MRSYKQTTSGSTLVEAMLACGIVAIFMAGLYDMNWRGLFILKSGVDIASATQITTNLSEKVRTYTWESLTDPAQLGSNVLAKSTAVGHLPNAVQTITVNPYPVPATYLPPQGSPPGTPPQGGETLQVTRDASGNITTVYGGNGNISTESEVQIDITVSWTSTFKSLAHKRAVRLIASKRGILGQQQ